MGATETEKILARGSGKEHVDPGEIVEVAVDRVSMHDPGVMEVVEKFNEIVDAKLWDPERISIFFDHHVPATSIKWANHQSRIRRFAQENGITHLYDCGR
ncbi:MAG: 3-isopropylmalate dehydratase large subunit, partial [Synergistaceae bacterium]|nr:3-isopropylmalate dehydratase large subunit [Synergistaceae bacterium]